MLAGKQIEFMSIRPILMLSNTKCVIGVYNERIILMFFFKNFFIFKNSQNLQLEFLCNGLLECSDGTDETNCMECCDGAIIQMVHRCDGKFDCPDGSDEMYCHNLSIYIHTNIYYRTFFIHNICVISTYIIIFSLFLG